MCDGAATDENPADVCEFVNELIFCQKNWT